MAHRQEPTPRGGEPERTTHDVSTSINRLVAESGAGRDRVLGLGVAVPGPIDAAAGLVRLSAATGLPALIDKDVIAAAVAERWAGAATETGNFLFYRARTRTRCTASVGPSASSVRPGAAQDAAVSGGLTILGVGSYAPSSLWYID